MKIDVLGLKQTLLYAQETFAATNGRNRHMSNWLTSGNDIHPEQTEIIMYQTEDGLTKIDVRMENETVWLTQAQMAELFQRERSGITKHIKNVFAEGEVDEKSNVKNIHIANSDKPVAYYSLDVIISVGYRVKSLRGTQFRIWANSILKEYLIKGFAMNDELLKQAGGGNYFDELMDRIRDIRSSEKVFWRKVLDIYATSVDYDPRTESSVLFFKTVQNKMHWAAHGQTAAEKIFYSVDSSKPNMGLHSFSGNHPTQSDASLLKTIVRKTSCWHSMTLYRLTLILQRCRHDAAYPCICLTGSTHWTAFSSSPSTRS